MGQVAARDKNNPSPRVADRLRNDLSQLIMSGEGQPGKPDADEFGAAVFLPYKPQRNHRSVIKLPVPLPERTGRKTSFHGQYGDSVNKILVIFFIERHLRSTKCGKGTFGFSSR